MWTKRPFIKSETKIKFYQKQMHDEKIIQWNREHLQDEKQSNETIIKNVRIYSRQNRRTESESGKQIDEVRKQIQMDQRNTINRI